MKKSFSHRLLKACGWTIDNKIVLPKKAVLCVAPHTSNWDFLWGVLFRSASQFKSYFFMKDAWFKFPLKGIMTKLGGIPVDTTKKTSLTQQIVETFSKHETFHIAITPEGTRKPRKIWKKGFMVIAHEAKVPLVIIHINYATKTVGFDKIMPLTGDVDLDMIHVKACYQASEAKYPKNFDK